MRPRILSELSAHKIAMISIVSLLCATIGHWLLAQTQVGGVDFACYLLNGRDLANGIIENINRYAYFPGVQQFWKTVYELADGQLKTIQGYYLSLIFANSALVGLILLRITKDKLIVLFSITCYLLLAIKCEGLYGVTEPLGTIPILFALLLIFPSDRLSFWKLLVLALGIGLSIFMKQQCGLLSLGVIGLLIAEIKQNGSLIKGFASFLPRGIILAIGSALTLVVLFYLEGSGLTGLLFGLQTAGSYEAMGSVFSHLFRLSVCLRGFLEIFLASSISVTFVKRKVTPNINLILFCIFAALFSFVQFWKRGYMHYALIPLPFMIISVCAYLPHADWERGRIFLRNKFLKVDLSAESLKKLCMAAMILYLFVTTGALKSFFRTPSIHFLDSAAPAKSVCDYLTPNSDVFVYPPQFNEIHWLCKTRLISSDLSYGWPRLKFSQIEKIVNSPTLSAVVLMKNEKGELLDQTWDSDFFVNDFKKILDGKALKFIDLPNARIYLNEI